MKKILIAMMLLSATSCKIKKPAEVITVRDTVVIHRTDTVFTKPDCNYDSLYNIIRSRDSALFEANFKLARVWYYDSLCLINKNNQQFLTGWIRRALEK